MNWAPEAKPQTPDEARRAPRCPGIVRTAHHRGITSIVHFTRIRGLKGILHTAAVKARGYLPEDDRVKYVYEENAPDRSRDLPWHGYVNLSLTNINMRMFEYSKRQHPDDEWVILEFGPEILGDSGVVFCTTNNAYKVVHRAAGPRGFEQMFAAQVPWGRYGSICERRFRAPNQTTDPQAEVLYPYELLLDHMHTVTVADQDTCETVTAVLSHFPRDPEVVLTPEAFR